MNCVCCGTNLRGKPKINVEGERHCYRCAKLVVGTKETERLNAINERYEREMREYNLKMEEYQEVRANWIRRKDEFIHSDKIGCSLAILVALFLVWVIEEIANGFGVLGMIVAFMLWNHVRTDYESQRTREFLGNYPEPEFNKQMPCTGYFRRVDHFPEKHDGSTLSNSDYRDIILKRDEYTCQACGKKKQKRSLEVHHIIPRSKGGRDNRTNLITLCKHCHDREDWYDHDRKGPTTFKKSRRSYRRWW